MHFDRERKIKRKKKKNIETYSFFDRRDLENPIAEMLALCACQKLRRIGLELMELKKRWCTAFSALVLCSKEEERDFIIF